MMGTVPEPLAPPPPAQEANTVQSEELKRKAMAFDDMSPDESIGAFGGSGQWVELCTVRDLREFEAALSTDAEPVKTAPAVAVKALEWRTEPVPPSGETLAPSVVGLYCIPHSGDRFYLRFRDAITLGDYSTLDKAKAAAQADYDARILSALSAQVQDVAGWQPIETLKPDHGQEVLGWVKVSGIFCAHPIYYSAFSRTWRRKLDGAEVEDVTDYQPLPASPASKHGEAE